jgi:hypothetical protein
MGNNPIILSGYNAAVFMADLNFKDDEYVFPYRSTLAKEGKDGMIRFENNPNYPYKTEDEERIARYRYEQKRRKFIYNYLKENYPDTNYAENFLEQNEWGNPLRQHSERTKNCKHLNEDGRHCDMKRANTTCYTCCYNCLFPTGYCRDEECMYINKKGLSL